MMSPRDRAGAPPVALVSESCARRAARIDYLSALRE